MSNGIVNRTNSVDVLIIGGGPAGLSAALGLSRLLFTTAIFDSQVYRNERAEHMHNVITADHMSPTEYRSKARKELSARYHTNTFVDRRVTSLKRVESGRFEAQDEQGQIWLGKKVVLASGVKDVAPDIIGFDDCWGRGIYHCMFCHGYEERGPQNAGILAIDNLAVKSFPLILAGMARRLFDTVTIYTNGNSELEGEIKANPIASNYQVDSRKISHLERKSHGGEDHIVLHFDGDSNQSVELGFLVHKPKNIPTTKWHELEGLEVSSEGNYVVNGPFNETNFPGVFAAGDAGVTVKAVPPALATGLAAAAGIAHQLVMEK